MLFKDLLRWYHDEKIIFASSKRKQRYVVASYDDEGVDIKRIDANEPQRITFAHGEKLINRVKDDGKLDFKLLDNTSAVRNTVLQEETLGLSADQKTIKYFDSNSSRLSNFLDILDNLNMANPHYKPAMLMCVLDGIEDHSLADNRITFDWIAPRFIAKLKSIGKDVTEIQTAQPFYHLSGDLFWLHAVRNPDDPMRDGGDGPSAARNKINYALLKSTYWNMLQDAKCRNDVRNKLESLLMLKTSPEKLLSAAESAIKKTGFLCMPGLIRRLLTAAIAKPFIILTGNSGTGKTQLAVLIAKWLSQDSTIIPGDPFIPGAVIESDRIKYYVHSADAQSVEFWNHVDEEQATKVSLPREMIQEWANVILSTPFDSNTTARKIREAVSSHSKWSSQLHSFETHLKAAAFSLLNTQQASSKTHAPAKTYAIVPVGADWTDNRNIIGFVNHLRKDDKNEPFYQSTPVLDLLLRAASDSSHPYFLILDEMNLSHVERYFSDFLSAMESKKEILLHSENQPLCTTSGISVPNSISIPNNVFILGTVNVDETTYMFSPKVLDRANVIEFRIAPEQATDFLNQDGWHLGKITPEPGAAATFLMLSRQARGMTESVLASPDKDSLQECRKSLESLFALLHHAHLEFAFRTISEVMAYLHVDFALSPIKSDWKWQDCMDAQVLQKILPKLHGSRRRIEAILVALAAYCEKRDEESARKFLLRDAELIGYPTSTQPTEVSFPLSYTKIIEMLDTVRRDQFVSYIQ